jgi:aconitate hydratase
LLEPFAAWDGNDHRPAAADQGQGQVHHRPHLHGRPWLRFRGHLDNISDNCLIGAINAFNDEAEQGQEPAHRRVRRSARHGPRYKAAGVGTIVVGDENYGEGSSREHAAMEPRHLGVRAVWSRASPASTRRT